MAGILLDGADRERQEGEAGWPNSSEKCTSFGTSFLIDRKREGCRKCKIGVFDAHLNTYMRILAKLVRTILILQRNP